MFFTLFDRFFGKKKESVFEKFKKSWEENPKTFMGLTDLIISNGVSVFGETVLLGSPSKGVEIYERDGDSWELIAQIPAQSFIKEVIGA